jgi:membrane protease YdiL (CAAX protease family)
LYFWLNREPITENLLFYPGGIDVNNKPNLSLKMKNRTILNILIYYCIAVSLSAMFRLVHFEWYVNMSLPFGLTALVRTFLEGSGPFIGGLIGLRLIQKKPLITFLGSIPKRSLLMVVIPIVLFACFGCKNNLGLNSHYYGFVIGISIVLYGILEEFGWRGYLLNELSELKSIQKVVLISVLWYAWHLSFLDKGTTLINEMKFLGIIVFATWGIGAVAERTKSVLASACFHILGNILFLSSLVSDAVDNQTRYIIF